MKMIKRAVTYALLICMYGAASVCAQSTDDSKTIDTIVVTANKTEENVQDLSSSITVFSENSIQDLRIENISDIAIFSPNFTMYENGVTGANTPAMRGMFADLHSHSVSVGLYVDGVPILDGMGYEQALLDVERVEVLKGPQGTLYGKSAEAGIVNIITKDPDTTFSRNWDRRENQGFRHCFRCPY